MPMLVALRGRGIDDILSSRIALRLPTVTLFCAILARLGVKDERVWVAMPRCFDTVPFLSAGILADYGDARALPKIEREIIELDEEGPSSLGRFDLELLSSL